MTTCGRCGAQDRPDRFIDRPVDLEAEATEDGRPFTGRSYDYQTRCRDRQACAQRARRLDNLRALLATPESQDADRA